MDHSENRTKTVSAGAQNDTDDRAAPGSQKKIISIYAASFLILATLIVGFVWDDLRANYRGTLAYWNVQLSSSADARVRVSALWLKERQTDTLAIAASRTTIRLLAAEGSRSQMAEIRKATEREIAHIAAVNGFLGGVVGDHECRIVAQVGLRPEMAQGFQEVCQGVQQTGEYRVDTFGMDQGHVWLTLTAPVMAEGRDLSSGQITRRIAGSVMMVSENWQDFILVFGSESIPTKTSETLIVWKKAGETLIFSPRLSGWGVPSLFRRPLAGSSFESRVARDGDVAFGEFVDYRGIRVLGAARRIAAGGDSVASKVDWDEALSEYHRHRVLDWLAGTLSLLLLGAVMVAQHRHAAARDFAERAAQQEALREREHRYRVLFESAGDGIFLLRDGRCVDCNQKALELFGCTREQLMGNAPSALSPPRQANGQDSQEAAEEKVRLALGGQTLHFAWQHRRCDGTPFEAEVTLSRLEIAGEAHLLALVRDVTEQKRAEEALRLSDQRYKDFISHSNEGVWRLEVDQPIPMDLPEEESVERLSQYARLAECNLALARSLGFSTAEEIVGRRLRDLIPSSDKESLDSFRLAARGGWRSRTVEFQGLDKEGTRRSLQRTEIPIVENGMLVRIWGITRDVTELRQTEEALRESEARYRDFIEHSSEGVWRLEFEQPIPINLTNNEEVLRRVFQYGYLAECNDAHAHINGFSAARDLVGKRAGELLSPSDEKRVTEFQTSGHLGHESRTYEVQRRGKSGNLRHFLRTEIPIVENGMLLRLWGITRDVTELRQAEEALRESEARLRLVVSQLPAIVWSTDKELRFTSHLGAGLRALGVESNQLVGTPVAEFVSSLGPEPQSPDNRPALGGESLSYEVAIQGRDYDVHVEPFRNTAGEITGTLGMALDVTARRQAETALRESEERFRATFENAGVGMALVDMQGHPFKANPALRQLLGYNEDELGRMTFMEFTHPDDRDLDWGLFNELIAGKREKYEIEKRYFKKGGDLVWGHLTASLVRGSRGRPPYCVGMVQDVTERKRAEEALRQADQRYKAFISHSHEGVWRVELEQPIPLDLPVDESVERLLQCGYVAECNLAFVRILGFSTTEEMVGRHLRDLLLFPDPERLDSFRSAARGGWQVRTVEFQGLDKGGNLKSLQRTEIPIVENGMMVRAWGITRDITERKRAEEALRQSEQRYKDFISHSHEGVWRLDLEQPIPVDLPAEEILERLLQYGYIAECNLAHARNFGFSTIEEMVGMRLRDLIPSSDQEWWGAFRSEARSGWRDRTVEFRSRDKSGNIKHFLRTEISIFENGMLVHVWGITRDVSELRRAEEERQRSFDQLRALAARLQTIREDERKRVAREIHDQLGQALTAIKIDLSFLVRELPAGEKQPSKRASSILQLVDESIRTVRRISTELRPGILDDLGLVAAIEWAGEDFEARTGTTCRFALPPEDIAVDPEHAVAIFRIFQETLTNVARHADASAVEIRLIQEGGDLTLEVHDNGKGIPEDKLTNGESLGILGMRERATLLGGEITISGPPGNGTTVKVRIPEARRT